MAEALFVLRMIIAVACLVAAITLLVLLARDRTPNKRLLDLLLGVEVLLVANVVLGIVHVVHDGHDVSVGEYIAYLVGAALILPVGVVWSSGEQSRGGTGVLLLAVLLVPFMFVRLAAIWAGAA
jgi:hypothetical protein